MLFFVVTVLLTSGYKIQQQILLNYNSISEKDIQKQKYDRSEIIEIIIPYGITSIERFADY